MAQRVQLTATVTENQLGQRLDQALAELFPDYSRSRIKEWILNLNESHFMSIRLGMDILIPFSKPNSMTMKPLCVLRIGPIFPIFLFHHNLD